MSRTRPAPVRKLINLPEDLVREISEFHHNHRLSSENEAIRQLLRLALEKSKDDAACSHHDDERQPEPTK